MVKRYIVWSPRVPTCMNWDNRDKAERFAEFWRTTALLGCMDWRVSPILDEPTDTGASPIAASRTPGRSIQTDAANDVLTTARDELVELLASKDAVIAELQRKLNDCTLSAVREAAAQSKRIADLEQQVATLSSSRVRAR